MRVELRTDEPGGIGEADRAAVDRRLGRLSDRLPDDATVTVELRVEGDPGGPEAHVAELTVDLGHGTVRASGAAATTGGALKLSAGKLAHELRSELPKPGDGVRQFPRSTPLELGATVREYWLARVSRQKRDSYAGVRLAKFPEDLRVYEHLIWASAPNTVIEIGALRGGSALWFRDRLRTLAGYRPVGRPRVISIDLEIDAAREDLAAVDPAFEESITLVAGDVTDPDLPGRVEALLPADARCLVVEDSAHVFETTMAALTGFARFVPPEGFFVVEDGYVDHDALRLREDWPRGVLPAIRQWRETAEGRKFRIRRDLELYGITGQPEGVLQRFSA